MNAIGRPERRLRLPDGLDGSLPTFSGPQHLPFRLDAAPGGPGALLIHGFPGTPAEMRPLGELLHNQGWSVRGLLLPGFGPSIARIADYRWQDWCRAVTEVLERMRPEHDPLLLAGLSLGGALAAAAVESLSPLRGPDGLLLLAPFWRSSPLRNLASRLPAAVLPRSFRPLAGADFRDSRLRESLRQFLPSLDLNDQRLQQRLRETRVPLSIIRQIFACGRSAFSRHSTARLSLPALVVQGTLDSMVPPRRTRRLLRRLGSRADYAEVEAGHDLVDPSASGWGELAARVLAFAAGLRTAGGDG